MNNIFRPNLKIPFLKLLLGFVVLGLMFLAFTGLYGVIKLFFPLYLIISVIYTISKLTVSYKIEDTEYAKENNLLFHVFIRKVEFKNISHFDIENGIIIMLKSGKIVRMDNSSAIELLSEKLIAFGIERKIVNRHNRPYMQKHE